MRCWRPSASPRTLAVGIVALVLASTGAAVADVGHPPLLARLVAGPLLTRALGLAESLLIGATLIGAVVAAPLGSLVGVPEAFAVVGPWGRSSPPWAPAGR